MKFVSFLFLYCISGLLADPVLAAPAASSASANYLDERPIQKLAFVLGNSAYADQEPIPSSKVDATKTAEALRNLGFTVTEVHDVKFAPDFWETKFQPFLDRIKENDFVVFYFSGHGLSYRGENFVAMTNLPKTILESEITNHLVALSSLRQTVTSRKPGLSLFLLDACRSVASNIEREDGNVEAVNKGPVHMRTTVENVAVGFSSDFGSISKGRETPDVMSYYTDALLTHFSEEGKEFGYIKRRTRLKVIADTNGTQVPWFSDSVSTEIYLRPSAQILADEKTVWLSRLNRGDYDLIWNFTQEYPVSRYVSAAKRWLAANGKRTVLITTKVSPQNLDRAFNLNEPNKRIVVPRIEGPFGFRTVANIVGLQAPAFATANKGIGDVLAQYDQLVVTRTMNAKALPDERAETIKTIAAGSTVQIKEMTSDSDGLSWLEFGKDGSSGFLPTNRALVGTADVGYALGEIEVGQGSGLESLIDERPIRDAVIDLKAKGHAISRVSVASNATSDNRLKVKLQGRVAHAFYVLTDLGLPPGQISSALITETENSASGQKQFADDRLRLRFFGY